MIPLVLAALLTAPREAVAETHPALTRAGYSASYGRALVPPTAPQGLITSLTYYEYSGPVGRILSLASNNPDAPRDKVELMDVELVCERFYDNCVMEYTYQVTSPSQADWDRYFADLDAFDETARGILRDGVPIDFSLDIASPYLGGDAWGGQFLVSRRIQRLGWLGLPVVRLNVGVGAGGYIFPGLDHSEVHADPDGTLRTELVSDDYQYTFVGMPVRATAFVIPWVAAFAQYDLNVLSGLKDRDRQPSPLHAGLELHLRFLYVRAEVVSTSSCAEGLSFGGEVGFGG